MGEGIKQMFDGVSSSHMEDGDESFGSFSSHNSSDLTEDETSPYNSHMDSNGPLSELSSLMAQLPIKRGLSKFYQGKSQSFTSLSNARCIDDLPKKESPYKREMKTCKSYAGGLDGSNRPCYAPGRCGKTISKKTSRGSCTSLAAERSSSEIFGRLPPVPVQKK